MATHPIEPSAAAVLQHLQSDANARTGGVGSGGGGGGASGGGAEYLLVPLTMEVEGAAAALPVVEAFRRIRRGTHSVLWETVGGADYREPLYSVVATEPYHVVRVGGAAGPGRGEV